MSYRNGSIRKCTRDCRRQRPPAEAGTPNHDWRSPNFGAAGPAVVEAKADRPDFADGHSSPHPLQRTGYSGGFRFRLKCKERELSPYYSSFIQVYLLLRK